MKKTYLTSVIVLLHLLSFGQQKKHHKNETASEALIGSWKFDYALYTHETLVKGVFSRDTMYGFHTDTIHFFNDKTFRFRSHGPENTDCHTHMGTWEIANKEKKLMFGNRRDQPPYEGPSPDLFFPLKIINANRIRIKYIVDDKRTPAFFNRISEL